MASFSGDVQPQLDSCSGRHALPHFQTQQLPYPASDGPDLVVVGALTPADAVGLSVPSLQVDGDVHVAAGLCVVDWCLHVLAGGCARCPRRTPGSSVGLPATPDAIDAGRLPSGVGEDGAVRHAVENASAGHERHDWRTGRPLEEGLGSGLRLHAAAPGPHRAAERRTALGEDGLSCAVVFGNAFVGEARIDRYPESADPSGVHLDRLRLRHAVADTWLSEDIYRLPRVAPQLAAQVPNRDAYEVPPDGVLRPPNALEQLLVSQYPPGVDGQLEEQPVLSPR